MTALADPTGPAAAAQPEVTSLILSVPGMRCARCIGSVEATLADLPGVAAARVNLGDKQVRVTGHLPPTQTLIDALKAAGFEAAELHADALAPKTDPEGRALLTRIGVAAFAMMNVMILSVAIWSGASEATRDLFHWISAIIAIPAVVYAARPFFASALSALRVMRVNMDVPISLAILLALGMSLHETWIHGPDAWFDAALSLTLFLLIGRYLDHRTRRAARSAAASLTALEVPRATLVTEAGAIDVPTAQLTIGDLIRVLPGTRVPVDAEVIEGRSDLDRSLLTGESLPVAAAPGTTVAAGETVLTAPLILRATAVGEDTSLRRMAAAVSVAEGARNRHVALADRAARIYAPLVHGLAAAGFLGWLLATGDAHKALLVAVATLIITCPCALGLAVPAVSVAASGKLFKGGVLLKSSTALERLAEVDAIVLDKTGTLTTGALRLEHLDPDAASVALALAQASDHPVSRAVSLALRGTEPAGLSDLSEVAGEGVRGTWRGKSVRLGKGPSGTELLLPGRPSIPLSPEETLRPGAAALIAQARQAGLPVTLLSGDRPAAVHTVATSLQIDDWRAETSPSDKMALLEERARQGQRVLMVGDGLNDAGALAAAHVSMAPASALDAARAASDAVLLGGDLRMVGEALHIARQARRRMLQNFGLAATYNAISVPLALAGFASPLMAAVAMSTSSILVVLNALRLRGARP
ncbi:copper-translocating P-type ATPase [Jannaschia pagri]|uniref:Copper-translocating P-type ATPase n=1 Tax=Jannaschia pagri TaxID=2829797 RepID=A0ABQ4NJT5_9RHOB|nr:MULTISPECIES: heavy metal translocating P-type ATPase [unclassified Jannaschia]GIT90820.1 copper-translocating P-type ATPase [Jannaschia sp. AI_61]GIT94652.1 copper-translocating P-type ATPase [Jannaschia sp. AI_62]